MRITITVNKELVDKVMGRTHSTTAAEAVSIALKDWLVFHRMRELSKKLANNSMYINNRQHIQELII